MYYYLAGNPANATSTVAYSVFQSGTMYGANATTGTACINPNDGSIADNSASPACSEAIVDVTWVRSPARHGGFLQWGYLPLPRSVLAGVFDDGNHGMQLRVDDRHRDDGFRAIVFFREKLKDGRGSFPWPFFLWSPSRTRNIALRSCRRCREVVS